MGVLLHWYGRIVAWYAHTASGKSCMHFETKLPRDSLFCVWGTLLLQHAHDLMKASASWQRALRRQARGILASLPSHMAMFLSATWPRFASPSPLSTLLPLSPTTIDRSPASETANSACVVAGGSVASTRSLPSPSPFPIILTSPGLPRNQPSAASTCPPINQTLVPQIEDNKQS